ncbi:hypothetical protein DFH07DRAFT_93195 [Mycena maculata]|uniref:Uncharacterized protein n=1 Tax=Mycena maculata TaxID=230809 RepID=A0AAD7IAN0_9AGAR|nr:hypothetical protein DFH07DRAFT_93195 [Mycena maculata]
MVDGAHANIETSSEAIVDNHESAPYAGAFFPGSQHFVVSGSTFTSNITQNIAETDLPADFRRIPLGDIDLRQEIRLDAESGIVERQRGSVRRMYSARIHGSKSDMTVALYQGDNAEEEWRHAISRYSWFRHPNFVQIFGAASASGICYCRSRRADTFS